MLVEDKSLNNNSSNSKYELVTELQKPVTVTTEEVIVQKKEIPAEFQWVVNLARIKAQGYRLKYIYNIKGRLVEQSNLKYFQTDSSKRSYVPVKPTTVLVQEFQRNEGFVTLHELSAETDLLDPDVDTSMAIFNVAKGL